MTTERIEFDFTSWPESVELMAALNRDGGEARWVGGCVRDGLLERPCHDLDLATTHKPARTMQLLEDAGIKAIPTGLQHGTVTAVCRGRVYEITTLRHDVETDGRHAVVTFTDDWQADAARRDFTINALYLDADGQVHDYFDGLIDLACGDVRFIGSARDRITEDVLRILRFFRFTAHYGAGDVDADGMKACTALAHLLPDLSAERIRVEMLKLLAAPDPAPIWQSVIKCGAIGALDLPLTNLDALTRLVQAGLDTESPDALARLAALAMPLDEDRAALLATQLRLSNAEKKRLLAMADAPRTLSPDHVAEDLYTLGKARLHDAVLMRTADGRITPDLAQDLLARVSQQPVPDFPLRGADLIEAGFASGPELGQALKQIENWWIADGMRATRDDCLQKLQQIQQTT